ncbi:MAG: efflux RND transporter periplasmic adaptor subunit [Aquisalimonadaceae bacterium]
MAIQFRRLAFLLMSSLLLAACDGGGNGEATAEAGGPPGALISIHTADTRTVEIVQRTIGRITSRTSPSLAAEVSGRIIDIQVDTGDRVSRGDLLLTIDPEPYELAQASARTDIRRLDVTIRNLERELARNRELLEDDYVPQSAVDDITAEIASLREQQASARIRLEQAELDLRNTRVTAPVDGEIDQRHVSRGDYTSPGEPLFRLVSQDLLRILLPYPETVAASLETGQPVRLSSPLASDNHVESTIAELRPSLSGSSRAVEAIVNVNNPGGWRQGGSVTADVVVQTRDSVTVPNIALVQRPAGELVYVIDDDTAHARSVEVGSRGSETSEILSGLEDGEVIAVDGAGFLSDGATVRTSEGEN